MQAVTVRIPAKINIGLAVGPRRADGFHDLHTLFAGIDLFDTVTVAPADRLALRLTGPEAAGLAADESNLAWRAARAAGLRAAITVDKQIPVAAGLAGGSADAAGVLVAAGRPDLAAELGSDVPFALTGGLAVGQGRGERLHPATGAPLHWVLAASRHALATPAVYAELDRLRPEAGEPALDARLLAAVEQGDPRAVAPLLRNDLQPAALSLAPDLTARLALGVELGALAAVVSGSGPTCLFLAADRAHALDLAGRLAPHCRYARAVTTGARTEVVS
ncbi:MAG TPA: 4-(cytidine 5'-diphospho)-2-C-methyl-D-erythritol kinase [Jatrophihabitans sp.]|nr:4-(cytidine 5'-diphospho)-2-C-methyl-D-erythritol kinase [Jatrophihabitans sp.]